MEKTGVLKYSSLFLFIVLSVLLILFLPSSIAPHNTGWACGGSSNYTCAGDTVCQTGVCTITSTSTCGDGTCSGSETYTSCPSDCHTPTGTLYTCSTQYPSYCTSQAQCDGIGGKWCAYMYTCYYPASSAPATCDTTTSGYCGDKICSGSETYTSCPGDCGTGTGGCTTCSSNCYSWCTTEPLCTTAGGKWCSGTYSCYSPGTTCPTSTTTCGNKICESGETSSSCSTDCGAVTSCSSTYPGYCYDSASCTSAGNKWCSTYCTSSTSTCPTCSSSQLWNCYTQTECSSANGQWCGTYCSSSCPTCSSSQVWNCYTEASCTSASGYWCKYSGTTTGVSSGWCSSSTCPSTTCSSSSAWNCYDETSCKAANGYWCKSSSSAPGTLSSWCSSSTCPSYTCSKESPWYCYTELECKNTGASWCGTYCSSSQCPTCSSSQVWNCYDETSCKAASGNWCKSGGSGYCSSYSCPTCSSSQVWNCYDEISCKGANGYWCGSNPNYPPVTYNCQSSSCQTYTCSKGSYWNCYNELDCKTAGGSWCKSSSYTTTAATAATTTTAYSGWCSDSCPTCSSSQSWNCYDETSCKAASGNWCNGYCNSYSCPTCSSTQKWNCYDESSCTKANGNWCTSSGSYTTASTSYSSSWCSDYSCPRHDCSKESPWNCYDKSTCTNIGGQWCNTYCSSSCPVCSTTQLWNCYTQTECSSANGQWCGTYCSDSCPTCSSSQSWNCYDETSCKAASGYWCKSSSSSSSAPGTLSSWCSSYSCPTCSSSQPWNCYDETSCKNANGNWCSTYCSSYSCPTCSSSQSWNCYNKADCLTAGGNWCGTWCNSYSCPGVCGNGVCESSESSKSCSSDCAKTSCPSSIAVTFDKATYNVGDSVLMSIDVGVPYTDVDVSASIGTGYTSSTSLTTDSSGIISYKFTVVSTTPGGTYTISAKTNVPGCTSVSSSTSVTISSRGYCGDKICNSVAGETPGTCKTDCAPGEEGSCPASKTCSNGKIAPCGPYYGTCHCAPCEFDENRIPPGCNQATDPTTGVLRVTCNSTCPPPPSDIASLKQKCLDNGGNPRFKTSYNNCNYFDCEFADEDDFYTGPDRCFSEEELEEVSAKCQKLGLPVKIKVHGDCKVARCTQTEQTRRCPVMLSSEKRAVEAECKLQGLQVIKKFDEQGCHIYRCGTPEDCDKELPDAAYNDCSLDGGELIVKKDLNDCITNVKCIKPSDGRDEGIEDITILPTKAELAHVALELAKVSIDIEKLIDEADKIRSYYDSADSSKKEIWERVVAALKSLLKEIENVQDDLRTLVNEDEISKEDVLEVKANLVKLSGSFDDVLYLMLSSKSQEIIKEEQACGSEEDCFERAFKICSPISFSPDENTDVRIIGIEDGKCVLEAELDSDTVPPETIPGVEPPYTMTCKVEDYAIGLESPEISIFPYCEGSLFELIKTYQTQSSPSTVAIEEEKEEAFEEEQAYTGITGSVIAYLENNKGPKNCVGKLECTKVCNKEPYTCLGYIDDWLRRNSGPGGVRSISELDKFCSENLHSCREWLLSKGVSLQDLGAKELSKNTITGFAIRR